MVTMQLICVFVFAYPESWFSHDAAKICILKKFQVICTKNLSAMNVTGRGTTSLSNKVGDRMYRKSIM